MNPYLLEIKRLFDLWGSDNYSESVSQRSHAEQCAALAVAAGSEDSLVVASLLHDIGHLFILDARRGQPLLESDDEHEATGARFVARFLGARVATPIALHVAAKRYLCAVDPTYAESLSPASISSLELQGGAMSPDEAARFERLPNSGEALLLRRWDDAAKVPDLSVAPFEEYVPMIEALAFRENTRRAHTARTNP